MDDRIQRIREMEARLNRITEWLETGSGDVREDIRLLDEYYRSPLWREDFEADEAGELPTDLPRGVLSEDAVYNALAETGDYLTMNWISETDGRIFDEVQMAAYLRDKFASGRFPEAQKALPYAEEKHKNTKPRKGPGNVPYISHPLTMTCHALAMGLEDDILLAALLLHDVTEDCGIPPAEMPVCGEVQEIVALVSKPKEGYEAKKYFDAIAENPKACMVKCIDRCNNLSTMAMAYSLEKIEEYIEETETWYPRLMEMIREQPEYGNAAWLLTYQIKSLVMMGESARGRVNRFKTEIEICGESYCST